MSAQSLSPNSATSRRRSKAAIVLAAIYVLLALAELQAKYQGGNESLWEHHGEAMITWGYGGPEMQCTKKSRK